MILDILEPGQVTPITLSAQAVRFPDGRLPDGAHRLVACHALGLLPRFRCDHPDLAETFLPRLPTILPFPPMALDARGVGDLARGGAAPVAAA